MLLLFGKEMPLLAVITDTAGGCGIIYYITKNKVKVCKTLTFY